MLRPCARPPQQAATPRLNASMRVHHSTGTTAALAAMGRFGEDSAGRCATQRSVQMARCEFLGVLGTPRNSQSQFVLKLTFRARSALGARPPSAESLSGTSPIYHTSWLSGRNLASKWKRAYNNIGQQYFVPFLSLGWTPTMACTMTNYNTSNNGFNTTITKQYIKTLYRANKNNNNNELKYNDNNHTYDNNNYTKKRKS